MLSEVIRVDRFTTTAKRGCYTSRLNPRRVDKVRLHLACGHSIVRLESAGIPKRARCRLWHKEASDA